MSDIKFCKSQVRDIDSTQVNGLETALSQKISISNLLAGDNITLEKSNEKVTIKAIENKKTYIRQSIETCTDTITLKDDITIYKYVYSDIASLVFDTKELTQVENSAITFELHITIGDKYESLSLPTSIIWINAQALEFKKNTSFLLAFRSFDEGTTWLGNIQCSW